MKKFRFSLDTVLRVKRQVEELRQKELAMVQARHDKVLSDLGGFENNLSALNDAQVAHRSGTLNLVAETWYQGSHIALSSNIIVAKRMLVQIGELLDTARNRAVEAGRERKVLEKLEENQRFEYQLKSNREEQSFMDELAQHALSTMAYASPSASDS